MRDTGSVTSPRRVVIGTAATADDAVDALARAARRSRDAGIEVVWLGGGVEAPAMAAVAVAEDADEVLLGPDDDAAAVRSALTERGSADVTVDVVTGVTTGVAKGET